MKKVILVCGVPGSGKTWVAKQMAEKFHYVPHDDHQVPDYLNALIKAATTSTRDIIGEAPFRISVLINDLRARGVEVVPIFILEPAHIVKARYEKREVRPIPKQHLTRVATVARRAHELGKFVGNSTQVLEYLKGMP